MSDERVSEPDPVPPPLSYRREVPFILSIDMVLKPLFVVLLIAIVPVALWLAAAAVAVVWGR